jgi:DNA-binding cell septation regulator SpoVG
MEAPRDFPQTRIPQVPPTRHHDVQILSLTPAASGNLRAFVDIQIGSTLQIFGCKVIQQADQTAWVAMPTRDFVGSDGTRKFTPIVKLSGALKADVEEAILQAWKGEASHD